MICAGKAQEDRNCSKFLMTALSRGSLTQVIEKLMSGETLLNLMLTVLGRVKFGRNFDDTDCMKVKVRIMKGGQRAGSQPQTSVEQTLSLQGPGPCSVQSENLQTSDSLSIIFSVNVFCPLPLS